MAHHIFSRSPHTQPVSEPAPNPTDYRTAAKPPSNADIARRAYEKYEARGRVDGFALEDWLTASHELAGDTVTPEGLQSPSQHPRSS